MNWRKLFVASRMAMAAICALAMAYWLQLQEPQWAILTVYLLPQESTGAALAKGAFRFLGTIIAAAYALLIVRLFSQDPLPLAGAGMMWMFGCYYGAARLRNFEAYGFMLAAFTGLLIIFQGAAAPADAWRVAADRTADISIGIACAAFASAVALPAHAGTQLRELMNNNLGGLSLHCASALRLNTPEEGFLAARRALLAKLLKLDALRSYVRFESKAMRVDDRMIRELTRASLSALAMARDLYLRLADVRNGDGSRVAGRLTPLLEQAADLLARIAADPAAFHDSPGLRSDLTRVRRQLTDQGLQLPALTDSAPLPKLANELLICERAVKMLRELCLVMLLQQAAVHKRRAFVAPSRPDALSSSHRLALLQGARAALSLMLLCLFWYATEWDQGVAGVTGLALMSYKTVSADDPGRLGWPYFRAVTAACVCAYLAMVFIYPWLEGFEMLAAFLFLVLLPAGLLIGTPRFAKPASTFTIFFVAAATTGNVFSPDSLAFANFCFGLIFGMFVCLMVARLLPVTAQASRRHAYAYVMSVVLPETALGRRAGPRAAREIMDLLVELLPGLSLGRPDHDTMLRGMLASASSAVELSRLGRAGANASLPEPARRAIGQGLQSFATLFAASPFPARRRAHALEKARNTLAAMWSAFAALDVPPRSPAARAVVSAAASLRLLEDRFILDQAFLTLAFNDEGR